MRASVRRVVLVILLCPVFALAVFAEGWEHLGKVDRVEQKKDGVELIAGKARVSITFFREGIVRVRVAPGGTFAKDRSWAVIEAPEPPAVTVRDSKEEVRVAGGGVLVHINKSPLLIRFSDAKGNSFAADEPTMP
ncbi:MAG TPA: DUF4968 domain-containing protein, partial [Candidatus Acidoferrum sp.]